MYSGPSVLEKFCTYINKIREGLGFLYHDGLFYCSKSYRVDGNDGKVVKHTGAAESSASIKYEEIDLDNSISLIVTTKDTYLRGFKINGIYYICSSGSEEIKNENKIVDLFLLNIEYPEEFNEKITLFTLNKILSFTYDSKHEEQVRDKISSKDFTGDVKDQWLKKWLNAQKFYEVEDGSQKQKEIIEKAIVGRLIYENYHPFVAIVFESARNPLLFRLMENKLLKQQQYNEYGFIVNINDLMVIGRNWKHGNGPSLLEKSLINSFKNLGVDIGDNVETYKVISSIAYKPLEGLDNAISGDISSNFSELASIALKCNVFDKFVEFLKKHEKLQSNLDKLVEFSVENSIVTQMLEILFDKELFNEKMEDVGGMDIIAFAKQYELIPKMIKVLTNQFKEFTLPIGREHYVIGRYRNIEKLVTALKDELSKKTETVTSQQASDFENLLARAKEAINFLDESWCKSLIEPIVEAARSAVMEAGNKLKKLGYK